MDNPRAVVAVDAIPTRPPTKLEAVIIPVNLPSPWTCSFTVGFVVPIPKFPLTWAPPVTWSGCDAVPVTDVEPIKQFP